MTTVDRILEKMPLYRVSTQITSASPIIIRAMRMASDEIMFDVVQRMTATSNLNDLAFFEVHKTMPGSDETILVVEEKRPWPTGVPVHNYGASAPTIRLKDDDQIEEDRLRKEINQFFERNTAQVPALPPPQPKPLTLPLHRLTLKVA